MSHSVSQPTVSIKPYLDESSKTWRVDFIVTGLEDEQQALRCADILTAMFCGDEIAGGH